MTDTYLTARGPNGYRRIVGPGVQTAVAVMHERGDTPHQIANATGLPVEAVHDIIAAFEYRAARYFKATR